MRRPIFSTMQARCVALSLAAAASAAGCSQPPDHPSSGAVMGTVGGVALGAQDAVFMKLSTTPDNRTVVAITSFSSACDIYATDRFSRGSVSLTLELLSGGPNEGSTAPGDYTLGQPPAAFTGDLLATWNSVDTSCGVTQVQATSGTVSVTEVSASSLVGTFDVTFGGQRVTGSFDAVGCADTRAAIGSPTCG